MKVIVIALLIGLAACSKPEPVTVCSLSETEYETLARFDREPCSVWTEN